MIVTIIMQLSFYSHLHLFLQPPKLSALLHTCVRVWWKVEEWLTLASEKAKICWKSCSQVGLNKLFHPLLFYILLHCTIVCHDHSSFKMILVYQLPFTGFCYLAPFLSKFPFERNFSLNWEPG